MKIKHETSNHATLWIVPHYGPAESCAVDLPLHRHHMTALVKRAPPNDNNFIINGHNLVHSIFLRSCWLNDRVVVGWRTFYQLSCKRRTNLISEGNKLDWHVGKEPRPFRFCYNRCLKRLPSPVSAELALNSPIHQLKSLIPLRRGSSPHSTLRILYRNLSGFCHLLSQKAHYHASLDILIL